MSRLRVSPVVEGHGEVKCIRILLERIWTELLGGEYIQVLQPIRVTRGKLVQDSELQNAVRLALRKSSQPLDIADPHMVLVLLDADEDLPCQLGPRLLKIARDVDSRADVACVLANPEYETWFVAAAESLRAYLNLAVDETIPDNSEALHMRKAWISQRFQRFRGLQYSETQDQPSMTHAVDLGLCRSRSASFDKLCRELERRRR